MHSLLLIDFPFNPLNHLLFVLDLLADALIFVLHPLDLRGIGVVCGLLGVTGCVLIHFHVLSQIFGEIFVATGMSFPRTSLQFVRGERPSPFFLDRSVDWFVFIFRCWFDISGTQNCIFSILQLPISICFWLSLLFLWDNFPQTGFGSLFVFLYDHLINLLISNIFGRRGRLLEQQQVAAGPALAISRLSVIHGRFIFKQCNYAAQIFLFSNSPKRTKFAHLALIDHRSANLDSMLDYGGFSCMLISLECILHPQNLQYIKLRANKVIGTSNRHNLWCPLYYQGCTLIVFIFIIKVRANRILCHYRHSKRLPQQLGISPQPNQQQTIMHICTHYYNIIYYNMRIVLQRVFEGWVKVEGHTISHINQGILVLVGLTDTDNQEVVQHMASQTLNMRLWDKDGVAWSDSVVDIQGEVLAVSQFTLYGFLKGNKPDFHQSMQADSARKLFEFYVEKLREMYKPEKIQTGKFQAKMEVGSVANGPVTIQYQKQVQQQNEKAQQKTDKSKKGDKSKLQQKQQQRVEAIK